MFSSLRKRGGADAFENDPSRTKAQYLYAIARVLFYRGFIPKPGGTLGYNILVAPNLH
jgi:hypothetical protein